MENPFDFDDAEAAKQFEKNTIFGVDSDTGREDDFMKVSLAAANMNTHDLDDADHGGSFKVASFKQPLKGGGKTMDSKYMFPDKSASAKDSTGGSYSVRGHTNTTTVVKKPVFELMDSQISAEDYKKIRDELANANKMIETLKFEKWSNIPVKDTIKRIITGKPYTLDGYRSLSEKKGLLTEAIKSGDGNTIITVVLFLERTLSTKIFQWELSNCPSACHHYIQHLRKNEDWQKLERFYKDLHLVEDAALLKYEQASRIKDIEERVFALHKWLNEYGTSKVSEIEELNHYISQEIKLLEKQRQIEAEDKVKEASDTIMHRFPRSCIALKPLIKTVEYCALYHYVKDHKFHPQKLKELFKLSEKQYEWAVLAPIAYLQHWTDVEELLTSSSVATKWFGKRSDHSNIGFENVVRVLHKAKANEEIIIKYANLIPNLEVRIKYGEKLSLHDVVIDAIVTLKDIRRLEEYRSVIGDTSRRHQQKINDLLHNTSIKWR